MNSELRRLDAAIDVSSRAAERLRASLSQDRALIEQGYGDAPPTDALRALDAFVQRFQQLYEHLTSRLYPAFYRAVELGDRPPPLRDLMAWLEGHGLIESGRVWYERTEIRNRLVHEYPLDASDRTAALRLAIQHSDDMLRDLENILEHVADIRNKGGFYDA